MMKYGSLPVGLFWATRDEIEEKEHVTFKLHKELSKPETYDDRDWVESFDEYKFQNEAVDKISDKLLKGEGGLILNATGSGKTRIAAMVASRFDCEFLFIVDQLVLLRQAKEDISKVLGEKVGFVGESKFKIRRFTVATIQTLAQHCEDRRFLEWFEKVDVIFIDEIHEQMNKSNFKVVDKAKPLSVIGLTATLELGKKHIRVKAYSLTGPIIYEYPLQRGMKEGVLSKGIGISVLYNNTIREIKAYTAQEAYDKYIVNNTERNYFISRFVRRAHKLGKYTIVLVDRLKHLDNLSKMIAQPHKVVSGTFRGEKIHVKERFRSKDKFEQGDVRIILANKVFKKGIDIKRVDCIINAAGRSSTNDAVQIFGRGIRRHKDKTGLIHFDMSDYDTLDSERKERNKHRETGRRKEKENWFAKAAKKRTSALRKSGIKIFRYEYTDGMDKDLFKRSEKWLEKELHR
jgi:superfamily II DNA or RNA helicase